MFYAIHFAVLTLCCAVLCFRQQRKAAAELSVSSADIATRVAALRFIKWYLLVFVLVWGGDWLQGPHIFTLYKDEKGFSENGIALLFVSGFTAAAISAVGVGTLADRMGRKYMCLLFCGTYTLSCLVTALCRSPFFLFIGRILGGVSTSILYSAFESWMVTEWMTRDLGSSGITLSYFFGVLTQANSVTAIVAGVFSEWLVEKTGTFKSPFLAVCVLLPLAACIIGKTWTENYGGVSEVSPWADAREAIKTFQRDRRVAALAMASCFFEGSMFLFVFFWTPSLQSAAAAADPAGTKYVLPYGLIFGSFMSSMMLGSLLFNQITNAKLLSEGHLLVYVFIVAGLSFTMNIYFAENESVVFWMWCLLEGCVGMYFPCMGYLKGTTIEDGKRAATYALMRIPLNILVVAALGNMGVATETGASYRSSVFTLCSLLLTCGAWLLARYIR